MVYLTMYINSTCKTCIVVTNIIVNVFFSVCIIKFLYVQLSNH